MIAICAGFDGADSDDWTAIRAETIDGYQFTPTYEVGGEVRPTIWDPAAFGGRLPRSHVHAAVEQMFSNFQVKWFYCDPPDWKTEIDEWALRHGEKSVMRWETYRPKQMHEALQRFVNDLTEGSVTHDGCQLTATHIDNARRDPKPFQRYLLSKPHGKYHQKIDAAMATVLAHEAASDARASGWTNEETSSGLMVW